MPAALLATLLAHRYLLLLPLTIVEGPVVMMASGFLVHLGVLDLWPAYFLLLFGDFIGDLLWYMVGRHGARRLVERFGRFFSVSVENVAHFETLFKKHQLRILFISKITMGLGFSLATLLAAGATRVPLRTYIVINLLGGFIWTGFLMIVGYYFANLYLVLDEGLRIAFVFWLVIIAFLLVWGFGLFMRNRFKNI